MQNRVETFRNLSIVTNLARRRHGAGQRRNKSHNMSVFELVNILCRQFVVVFSRLEGSHRLLNMKEVPRGTTYICPAGCRKKTHRRTATLRCGWLLGRRFIVLKTVSLSARVDQMGNLEHNRRVLPPSFVCFEGVLVKLSWLGKEAGHYCLSALVSRTSYSCWTSWWSPPLEHQICWMSINSNSSGSYTLLKAFLKVVTSRTMCVCVIHCWAFTLVSALFRQRTKSLLI